MNVENNKGEALKVENSEQHFDHIADDYDYWKNHNRYYYQTLFKLYGDFIPKGSNVVEIGCGTGDIISRLEPRSGLGIDVSDEMIRIARKKHADKPTIKFERADISQSKELFNADFVFLADVLEHVNDLPVFLNDLSARILPAQAGKPNTKVIISVANPIWEWLLMLAEKWKMKMPEGPHKRYSVKATEEMFAKVGLMAEERGYRLLVPKKIWGAEWVNERFYRSKLLEKWGFIVYWVLTKHG